VGHGPHCRDHLSLGLFSLYFLFFFVMANTTASITNPVNLFYDRVLLERATPLLLHTAFGQVRDIPQGNTNVINFRRYSAFAAATTALSAGAGEGVTPAGTDMSITDVPCTVLQYGAFTVVTDFLAMTTMDPVFTEAAQILGEQAGLTLDTLCANVVWATTSVQYADATSPKANAALVDLVAADVLTATDMDIAIAHLMGHNAKNITTMVNPDTGYSTTPVAPSYVAIIHPRTINVLYGITGFQPVELYARAASDIMPGEIGKYRQLRFVASTNVNNGGAGTFATAGAGGITVDAMLILAKNAFGVTRIAGNAMQNIRKELGSSGTADPLNQRATSGWKATFGAVILNQEFLLRLAYHIV
jgi:N4-gp56 family major capsid protein